MLQGKYLEAQRLAERIAADLGEPRFYREKSEEVAFSRGLFEENAMVRFGMCIVEERANIFGHGLSHVRKVAVDAGALVIIEGKRRRLGKEMDRLLVLAQLAGVLHDIKRTEPDHARRGAEEAAVILKDFDIDERERLAVIQAIRNHEAFKPAEPLDEPSLQILSDVLYDADKFRWGPDNFTETVWMMVAPLQVPLADLMESFAPSMRGIERIKDTFRTATGMEYGPDFIAMGLEIGERLYQELVKPPGGDEGHVQQHR
ncbi:MAG: HD domain-containing protein [Actinomycetota bacterium]|nr:HD domain-containing protein [Actinomycetota bacterium]